MQFFDHRCISRRIAAQSSLPVRFGVTRPGPLTQAIAPARSMKRITHFRAALNTGQSRRVPLT